MRPTVLGLCLGMLVLSIPAPALAQTTTTRSEQEIRASYEKHKGEFDYLLGDWEFTADSKEYGSFRGYWSAVRLATGQILDEYRVVGDNGQVFYASSTLRNYNGAADRWELVSTDGANGIQEIGTGQRVGEEMHIEQRFGVATAKPSTWKIRYYDIQPDRFSWTADRSTDNGKTWVTKHQPIEARRVGPARTLGPLATGKSAGGSSAPQSSVPAGASDPVSGKWGPPEGTLLDLAYDGKGAVTGTVFWGSPDGPKTQAPIRTGTFDPQSGTLKLQGEAKRPDTGEVAAYVIQGTLSNGTLEGTYTFADRTGNFRFSRK